MDLRAGCYAAHQVYAEKDLASAVYQLVSGTKMIDVVEEEYKKVHATEEAPKGMCVLEILICLCVVI